MNQKISRLLQPGMRLYFIVIALFALSAVLVDFWLAVGYGTVGLILLVYSKLTIRHQRGKLLDYLEELSHNVEAVRKDNMSSFPMPMVIFRLDNLEIIWSNARFKDMTGKNGHIFEVGLADVLPQFDTKWLMEGATVAPRLETVGARSYQVFGNIGRAEDAAPYQFLGTAYFMDVTEFAEIDKTYWETRPVCGLIVLDNYGELLGNLTEKEKSAILASIDEEISQWCATSGGFLCRFDRDRYVHIVEERDLEVYIRGRFSLLDRVREIVSSAGIAATVSVGIGKGGVGFGENYEYAKLSIEMALSRGGDQVVVRDQYNFEFYGGKTTAQERRTKVKSRVTAESLEKLFRNGGQIFIMGHGYADYDSFGAACGVFCIARKLQKEAKIVMDHGRHAVGPLLERIRGVSEYQTALIMPEEAKAEIDENAILVIVDTNRPGQVEVPELLQATSNIVVIDHHRRAAEYIQDATINFHEPYASSACELVTELMQYIVNQSDILRVEAEALLAGLAMDTKNFTLRTGSRTFEAAAFLRRAGANTAEVKKLMQSDFVGTVARYDVVRQAALYRDGIVISAPDQTVDRVIAAMAADELLNITDIRASFVLFPVGTGVVISARSIGEVNVQFILEKLGGGGNRSTAGAQVKDRSHAEVLEELKVAIDAYLQDDMDQKKTQEHVKEGSAI